MNKKNIFVTLIVSLFIYSCSRKTIESVTNKKELFDYEINMLICYGQSLSVDRGATNEFSNFRNTLSFQGGCNEFYPHVDITDSLSVKKFYGEKFTLLDSIENKNWPPVASAAVAWMNLLEEENGINLSDSKYQFLLSSPGTTGIEIEKLSIDTEYYNRLLFSVKKGSDLANVEHKTFGVPVLFWLQGESNIESTKEAYLKKMELLFNHLNRDIKQITGQTKDVIFITYQTSPLLGMIPHPSIENPKEFKNSGPSFAQVELSKLVDNVYLGGAMYQFEYKDIWHPKDQAVVGHQLGIIAKRIINDNLMPKVFGPVSYKIEYKNEQWYLYVTFDVPVLPMRFDLSGDIYHNPNGKQPNYGFKLETGENIIEKEPYIENKNTLVFICNKNPEKSALSYATNGHYGGGNLCDSQNITIRNKNNNYPVDNFCPAFNDFIID